MRTLIQGGWVVGFDGRSHQLFRDGMLVFEDNNIVQAGPRFDGQVDRTIDAHGMLSCWSICARRTLARCTIRFGRWWNMARAATSTR